MELIDRVRETRRRLAEDGPEWTRREHDFATVTLPERDCDRLRDLLIADRAETVVEVGLAYGSSALAIGEALVAGGGTPRHVIIDPFQRDAYHDVGWNLLTRAGLDRIAELIRRPSSEALPRLQAEGLVADAAFVDGSHRFHEVFVDLYYLRKIVKPGGLIVLDDDWAPSIRTAVRYFERNLGWTVLTGAFDGGTRVIEGAVTGEQMVRGSGTVTGNPRCRAIRLPDERFEPAFDDFRQFVE
ncbi:class I SAM-dependent methyltransferase [Actinoplanes sichuanensis]|uniref:Class I SAM-dependent methyltransferase n=1 Tax=Actinoplanes sichuanensis TaxID=512349 RepID=A0ABW4AP59_9ACTN|nr:class I SAM-dependent methyltransferase [Actinoplanes sichuanensis]